MKKLLLLALLLWGGFSPHKAFAQVLPVTPTPLYGKPQDVNVAVLTTATPVGVPSNYHYIVLENEGTAAICASFATSAITAPSGSACATGVYLAAGGTFTLSAAFGMIPNTQLYAIAAAAGTNILYESAQ